MKTPVAGILDKAGNLRVVVGQQFDVNDDERIFVLPSPVEAPVQEANISALVERVQVHVTKKLAPDNHCGTCHMCCILPYAKEGDFEKPSNTVCPNCVIGFGCKLYQNRPNVCKNFKCIWLKSQDNEDRMGPELRPDRCGAFFEEEPRDSKTFNVHGEPNEDAVMWIKAMQAQGYKGKKVTGYFGEKT